MNIYRVEVEQIGSSKELYRPMRRLLEKSEIIQEEIIDPIMIQNEQKPKKKIN